MYIGGGDMSLADLIADVETVKPLEQRFLEDFVKAHIEVSVRSDQPIPKDYTRPSSLGGCMRTIYFMRTGAKRDPFNTHNKMEVNSLGILESGTDRHARIQEVVKVMEEQGNLVNLDIEDVVKQANEKGINTEFIGWNEDHTEARCCNKDDGIYFQPDGCFCYGGETMLLEIKTCSVNRLKQVQKKQTPFPEHLTQATAYAMGLGLDKVLYFYECRDNTERYPILVTITDEMKQQVRNKLHSIDGYIERHEVPPMDTKHCFFCKYKKACKECGA